MYRRLGQTSLSLHSTSKLHRMIYTATHYPSVFISQELSPDLMDFSSFKLESKRVFEQLQTKHVSPEEFKYQLPDQNIPGKGDNPLFSLFYVVLGMGHCANMNHHSHHRPLSSFSYLTSTRIRLHRSQQCGQIIVDFCSIKQ